MMIHLYKVTVASLNTYYVLAKSFTEAEAKALKAAKTDLMPPYYIAQIELLSNIVIR